MLMGNDRLRGYMPGMIIVPEKETAAAFDKKGHMGISWQKQGCFVWTLMKVSKRL
jgi:hypothetical protein